MSRARPRQLTRKDLEAVADLLGQAAVSPAQDGGPARARPAGVAEVAALLRLARTRRFPVLVDRRRAGDAPCLVLDLAHFRDVGAVDSRSLLVEVGAGVPGGVLEETLQRAGYRALLTLPGDRTVGAHLASMTVPPAAWRGGESEPCAGLVGVFADGTELRTRTAPRSATGPDLKHLLLGTGGRLGVILRVTLRLAPLGLARAELAWSFEARHDAADAIARLTARGVLWPGTARELEVDGRVVVAVRLTGHAGPVAAAAALGRRLIEATGGVELAARETRELLARLEVDPAPSGAGPGPLDDALARLEKSLDPHDLLNPREA